jgi:hypothetical protein|tara:strand:- start:1 stop:213 length:213 start_codon:yes stop_codon:yes gene_type:complete
MITGKMDMKFVYLYRVDFDSEEFGSQILSFAELKEVGEDWDDLEYVVDRMRIGENVNMSDEDSQYIIRIA